MLTNCALQDMRRRGKAFQPWLPRFDCPGIIFLYVPIKLRSLDFNSLQFKKRIGKVSFIKECWIIIPLFLYMLYHKSQMYCIFTGFACASSYYHSKWLYDDCNIIGKRNSSINEDNFYRFRINWSRCHLSFGLYWFLWKRYGLLRY